MSDSLHCEIHDMLENHLQGEQANLAEVAAKVTEVLADLILLTAPGERHTLMADVLANLGGMVLEKSQESDPEIRAVRAIDVAGGGRCENALIALDNGSRHRTDELTVDS
jgi:hypothetical protein